MLRRFRYIHQITSELLSTYAGGLSPGMEYSGTLLSDSSDTAFIAYQGGGVVKPPGITRNHATGWGIVP